MKFSKFRLKKKIQSSFGDPNIHLLAREIIRKYSSNKRDIRDAALEGIDLTRTAKILDMGCGFGHMSEKICNIVPEGSVITGIDACYNNRKPFLEAVKESACRVDFIHYIINKALPFLSDTYDLIICSYSIYFFPAIVPEVSRVLKSDGLFLVITHSENSFEGLYRIIGLDKDKSPHPELVKAFSAENGYDKLNNYFRNIKRIDFKNRLTFAVEDMEYLTVYARFKLPLLLDIEVSEDIWVVYEKNLKENLTRMKRIVIEKNDAIFQCRGPLCP